MKDLVIIGAGGLGHDMANLVGRINEMEPTWNLLGFVDKQLEKNWTKGDYPVLGTEEDLLLWKKKPYFAVGVSDSKTRERIANRFLQAGFTPATIVYPSNWLGPNCQIGEGAYIADDSLLGTNVKIGSFCVLNGSCNVGHSTVIDDFSTVMAFSVFGGDCYVGKHSYFGLRCTMINDVKTVDDCTFGACSCIVKDATEPGTYVGVPAKLIKPLKSK